MSTENDFPNASIDELLEGLRLHRYEVSERAYWTDYDKWTWAERTVYNRPLARCYSAASVLAAVQGRIDRLATELGVKVMEPPSFPKGNERRLALVELPSVIPAPSLAASSEWFQYYPARIERKKNAPENIEFLYTHSYESLSYEERQTIRYHYHASVKGPIRNAED